MQPPLPPPPPRPRQFGNLGPKLKSHQIYLKICTIVNLKVLNMNLIGFSFSQNLLPTIGNSELINYTLPYLCFCKRLNLNCLTKCPTGSEYANEYYCEAIAE